MPTKSDELGECPGCLGTGLVPAIRLPLMTMTPCDGCLGRGSGKLGEECVVCGGYGVLVRDFDLVNGVEAAA
ncbi:MAG: hypothetical protein ACR2J8_03340 [Thermomicrobiales bacterium]